VSFYLKWKVYTPNPFLYNSSELFQFERIFADYIDAIIKTSPTFTRNDIFSTNLEIRDQKISIDDVQSILDAQISVLYEGKKIEDFADILSTTMNDEAENILGILIDAGFYQSSAISSSLILYSSDPTTLIASNTDNRVLFVCLLIVTTLLFLIATGIVLYALRERKANTQLQVIRKIMTVDTDDSCSPSAATTRIGARAVKIDHLRDPAYEFDAKTNRMCFASPDASVSTYNSRNPLGIVRLNTLQDMMLTPKFKEHAVSMYSVGLDGHKDSGDRA
jgi:hypothetical protein